MMKRLDCNFEIFIILALFNSCGYSQERTLETLAKAGNQVIKKQTRDLKEISSKINEPASWVKEGRVAFYKQKHRLEFNGCLTSYNGKSFILRRPLKELISIFGKNYRVDTSGVNLIIYDEIGITLHGTMTLPLPQPINDTIESIDIWFNYLNPHNIEDASMNPEKLFDGYILVEGIPIKKGTLFQNVFAESTILYENSYDGSPMDKNVLYRNCKGYEQKDLIYSFLYPSYLDINDGYLKKNEILQFEIYLENDDF